LAEISFDKHNLRMILFKKKKQTETISF